MSTRSQEFFDSLHAHRTRFSVTPEGVATEETTPSFLTRKGGDQLREDHARGFHSLGKTTTRFRDGSVPSQDDVLTMRQLCTSCKAEAS